MVRSMRGAVVVAVAVVVAALVVCGWGNVQMASADTSPSQCKEERNLLVNACRPVIYGRSPSADCCQRVRVSHVECVCPYVTPKTAPPSLGSLVLTTWLRKLKGVEGQCLANSSVGVSPLHEEDICSCTLYNGV
ncbi:hypothetical protein AAG906_010766 [Vitis piasezkii]